MNNSQRGGRQILSYFVYHLGAGLIMTALWVSTAVARALQYGELIQGTSTSGRTATASQSGLREQIGLKAVLQTPLSTFLKAKCSHQENGHLRTRHWQVWTV